MAGGGSAREYGRLPSYQSDSESLQFAILFTMRATSMAGISLVLIQHGS